MLLTLIGYRATGKTSLAKKLADRLGWDWIDADVDLQNRTGKTISQIFETEGESAFRQYEAEVIADICRRDRLVLASGGGAPLREENAKAMSQAGPIVWLKAPAETIWQRIQGDKTTAKSRPNLTDKGGLAEIVEVLAAREPIYRELAGMAVDTEDRSLDELADHILAELNRLELI